MMANRLIDALTAKAIPMLDGACPDDIINKIRLADKFDFGPLHLEGTGKMHPSGGQIMSVPELTADENKFIDEGLIPFPSPLCWFEFTLNGYHSGLLVHDDWLMTRIDFDWQNGPKGFLDGIWFMPEGEHVSFRTLSKIQRAAVNRPDMHYVGNVGLARYLLLMLNSKSTEVEPVRGKRCVAGAKSLSKREPLPDHRVVRILPRAYVEAREAEGSRERLPPRLHWRRSHLRHFDHQTPGSRWKSDEVYRGVTGWWVTVIPRELVGKAEVGVVSHEYRVMH